MACVFFFREGRRQGETQIEEERNAQHAHTGGKQYIDLIHSIYS